MQYLEYTEQQIIEIFKNSPYYLFGSENSIDKDAVIFFETLPNNQACKKIEFYFKTNLDINLNCCVLKDGIIVDCHKGSSDEMNNSFYYTFNLHSYNKGENPVIQTVERIKELKLIRCVRIILSLLSKSQYRPEIKKALKDSFSEQLNLLNTIEFNSIKMEILNLDILKSITFQLGQTYLLLVKDTETYTKTNLIMHLPFLKDFINREQTLNFESLFYITSKLIKFVKEKYEIIDLPNRQVQFISNKNTIDENSIILDLKNEKVISIEKELLKSEYCKYFSSHMKRKLNW